MYKIIFYIFCLTISARCADEAPQCERIPPMFWCQEEEISQKCGFAELCKRFRNATTGYHNSWPDMRFVYEAMCPFSHRFMFDQLMPMMMHLIGDHENNNFGAMEMLPRSHFGVADYADNGENATLTCTRGMLECELNKQHLCSHKYLTEYPGPLPYIHCMSNYAHHLEGGMQQCFYELAMSENQSQSIRNCVQGEEGEALHLEAAKKIAEHSNKEEIPFITIGNETISVKHMDAAVFKDLICPHLPIAAAPVLCGKHLDW